MPLRHVPVFSSSCCRLASFRFSIAIWSFLGGVTKANRGGKGALRDINIAIFGNRQRLVGNIGCGPDFNSRTRTGIESFPFQTVRLGYVRYREGNDRCTSINLPGSRCCERAASPNSLALAATSRVESIWAFIYGLALSAATCT